MSEPDNDLLTEMWRALHRVPGWSELGIIRSYNVIVMKIGDEDHYLYLRRYRPNLHPPLIQPDEMRR